MLRWIRTMLLGDNVPNGSRSDKKTTDTLNNTHFETNSTVLPRSNK